MEIYARKGFLSTQFLERFRQLNKVSGVEDPLFYFCELEDNKGVQRSGNGNLLGCGASDSAIHTPLASSGTLCSCACVPRTLKFPDQTFFSLAKKIKK